MPELYTNWSIGGAADVRSHATFCSLRGFIGFVEQVNYCFRRDECGLGFYDVKNRERVIQKFNSLQICMPFSKTERFPGNVEYLDTCNGAVRDNLDKILSACNLPKNVDETSLLVQEAKRSFDEAFSELRKFIYDTDEHNIQNGVYRRETFEAHYGLHWGQPGQQEANMDGKVTSAPADA